MILKALMIVTVSIGVLLCFGLCVVAPFLMTYHNPSFLGVLAVVLGCIFVFGLTLNLIANYDRWL